MLSCEQPVEQGGADIADMQKAGRRGRYADVDGHDLVLSGFLEQ
jgi:hypothetical protein